MAKERTKYKSSPGKAAQAPPVKFERTEDFVSEYANNVRFETTVHDLKMVFGQTDLNTGKEVIEQHTGITIPWSLVRLMIYFLRVNLDIHESQVGKAPIPPFQAPPPPPELSPTEAKEPNARKIYELVKKAHDDIIANP
jgi:hypothetical protein